MGPGPVIHNRLCIKHGVIHFVHEVAVGFNLVCSLQTKII